MKKIIAAILVLTIAMLCMAPITSLAVDTENFLPDDPETMIFYVEFISLVSASQSGMDEVPIGEFSTLYYAVSWQYDNFIQDSTKDYIDKMITESNVEGMDLGATFGEIMASVRETMVSAGGPDWETISPELDACFDLVFNDALGSAFSMYKYATENESPDSDTAFAYLQTMYDALVALPAAYDSLSDEEKQILNIDFGSDSDVGDSYNMIIDTMEPYISDPENFDVDTFLIEVFGIDFLANSDVTMNLNSLFSPYEPLLLSNVCDYDDMVLAYNGLTDKGKGYIQSYMDEYYDGMTFEAACQQIVTNFAEQLGADWRQRADAVKPIIDANEEISNVIFNFQFSSEDPSDEEISAFLDSLLLATDEYNTELAKVPAGIITNDDLTIRNEDVAQIAALAAEYKSDISKFDISELSSLVYGPQLPWAVMNLNYFMENDISFYVSDVYDYDDMVLAYSDLTEDDKLSVQSYMDAYYDGMTFEEACQQIEANFAEQLGADWRLHADTVKPIIDANREIATMIIDFEYSNENPSDEEISAFLDSLLLTIDKYNTELAKVPADTNTDDDLDVSNDNIAQIAALAAEYKADISKFDISELSSLVYGFEENDFISALDELLFAIDDDSYTKDELVEMYTALKLIYDGMTEEDLTDVNNEISDYADYYSDYGTDAQTIMAFLKESLGITDPVPEENEFVTALDQLILAIGEEGHTDAEYKDMYNALKLIYDGMTEEELTTANSEISKSADSYAEYGSDAAEIMASLKETLGITDKVPDDKDKDKDNNKNNNNSTPPKSDTNSESDNPDTGSAGMASAVAVMLLAGAALTITARRKQH